LAARHAAANFIKIPPMVGALFILMLMAIVIAAGAILIWSGWRGTPALSQPTCSGCGYDLRGVDPDATSACPECGADLSTRHAVRFGRLEPRPLRIAAGVGVFLLPFCVLIVIGLLQSPIGGGPTGAAGQSNDRLISSLKLDIEDFWSVQELARRYRNAELTPGQIDEIRQTILDAVTSQSPDEIRSPKAAELAALLVRDPGVSDEQKQELYEAYYHWPLDIALRPRARRGANAPFKIKAGRDWQLPDTEQVYKLNSVTVNGGQELKPTGRDTFAGELTATSRFGIEGDLPMDLPVGTHTLTFEVEVGIAPQKSASGPAGIGTRSRSIPVLWRDAVMRWTQTGSVEIEVLPEDEPSIELVENEEIDDTIRRGMILNGVYTEIKDGQPRLLIDLSPDRNPPVPISFDVYVELGGREHRIGSFFISEFVSGGSGLSQRLKEPLPESIDTCAVILRPSPESVEDKPKITKIWAGTIRFEEVEIQRFDLETP
jgi:hypothetical protein